VKTDLVVEESYARSSLRPNYQVDARLQQEVERTRSVVKRRLGQR
jgi:hypothetical protein